MRLSLKTLASFIMMCGVLLSSACSSPTSTITNKATYTPGTTLTSTVTGYPSLSLSVKNNILVAPDGQFFLLPAAENKAVTLFTRAGKEIKTYQRQGNGRLYFAWLPNSAGAFIWEDSGTTLPPTSLFIDIQGNSHSLGVAASIVFASPDSHWLAAGISTIQGSPQTAIALIDMTTYQPRMLVQGAMVQVLGWLSTNIVYLDIATNMLVQISRDGQQTNLGSSPYKQILIDAGSMASPDGLAIILTNGRDIPPYIVTIQGIQRLPPYSNLADRSYVLGETSLAPWIMGHTLLGLSADRQHYTRVDGFTGAVLSTTISVPTEFHSGFVTDTWLTILYGTTNRFIAYNLATGTVKTFLLPSGSYQVDWFGMQTFLLHNAQGETIVIDLNK